MKMRRGASFWPGELGNMIYQFNAGDVVKSTMVVHGELAGIVRSVEPKTNKVLVAWSGGSVVQHDPDEITLIPAPDMYKTASDSGLMLRRSR